MLNQDQILKILGRRPEDKKILTFKKKISGQDQLDEVMVVIINFCLNARYFGIACKKVY